MRWVKLKNARTGIEIGETVWMANSFLTRLRGLLGRPMLRTGEGLWIIPCRQIHMLGMRYPISVWFIDQNNQVCQIIDSIRPGEVSPLLRKAASVLEFPAHWAENTGTHVGDRIICSESN